MTTLLRISAPPASEVELTLRESGLMRMGRDPGCDLRIDHIEVEPHAAVLELRKGECWLQNKNPYNIFVGQSPLAPESWTHWPASETVSLTRKVSLRIAHVGVSAAAQAAEGAVAVADADAARRKRRQWAVIAACLIVGAWLLTRKPADPLQAEPRQLESLIARYTDLHKAARKSYGNSHARQEDPEANERQRLIDQLWEIQRLENGFRPNADFVEELLRKYRVAKQSLTHVEQKSGGTPRDLRVDEVLGQIEDFIHRRMDELASRARL